MYLYWESTGTAKCGLTNHIVIVGTNEIWPAYKYTGPLDLFKNKCIVNYTIKFNSTLYRCKAAFVVLVDGLS